MLDLETRRKHCTDTIARSAAIAASTPGGSLRSWFVGSQLPALSRDDPSFPNLTQSSIEIHNSDAFALARTLRPTHGRIGVLNLASNSQRAGGWQHTLSSTQEEALCYSSTLYETLRIEWYPWPNFGPKACAGIFSPDVVVFKDTLDNKLVDLKEEDRLVLSVITIAAPCWPELTDDQEEFTKESDLKDLQEKIVLILRLAAKNGVTALVLGAMGCGAYGCPPPVVAREMKRALASEEFNGWFDCTIFAIFAAGPIGQRNLEVFRTIFAREKGVSTSRPEAQCSSVA